MQCLKEITDWDYPNHSYLLNEGGRLVAYRKTGEKEWFKFKKPKSFYKTHRRFVKLPIPDIGE